MDREGIERRDFPTGRRGYDPEAVDAHLRRVADEFEALRDRARHPAAPPPLSAGTSEQVRVILEAAERSAAELRAKAGDEAGAHVARVGEAAEGMLARLEDLERELGGLIEALRRGGERLTAGLAELQAQVRDATPANGGRPAAPEAPDLGGGADAAPLGGDPGAAVLGGADAAPLGGDSDADEAGARLIALNMALSGTPREDTARYLAEHFALADAEALLDDIYARADR